MATKPAWDRMSSNCHLNNERKRDAVKISGKNVTLTCLERGKPKTYTGELMSNDIGVVIIWTWDQKGSGYIKRVKKSNILSYQISE